MLSGKAAKHLDFAQRFFGAKNAPQNDKLGFICLSRTQVIYSSSASSGRRAMCARCTPDSPDVFSCFALTALRR